MTKIADKFQNLNDSYANAYQREGIYNVPGESDINEIKQTLSNRKLKWNARLDFLESKINTGDVKYLSSLKDILSQYNYLNSNRVANADIVKNKLAHINETIRSLEKKHYDASYKEAYEDLEDKVEVVPIPQATEEAEIYDITPVKTQRKKGLLSRVGQTTAIPLLSIVLMMSIATNMWFYFNNLTNRKENAQLNQRVSDQRVSGIENTIKMTEDKYKQETEAYKQQIQTYEKEKQRLTEEKEGLTKQIQTYEQEKQAAKQKTPEIPTQVAGRNPVNKIKDSNKKQKTQDYKITGNGGHFKGGWYKKLDDPSIPDEFDAKEEEAKRVVRNNLKPLYDRAEYLSNNMKKATHPKTFWQYITTPFRIGRTMFLGGSNLAATTIAAIPVENHPNAVEKVEDFTDALPGGPFNDELHNSIPTNPRKAIRLVKEHPGKAATALITDWGIGYRIERSNDKGISAETIVEEEFGGGEDGGGGLGAPKLLGQILN